MPESRMPQAFSRLQAWAHDNIVAERALRLHAYILEHGKLASILSERKQCAQLDVGCGGGQSAIRLKKLYPHLTITGIDLSEVMIAAARERAKRSRADIEFRVADAQALPFPDARFDIVFSFGSAKHWTDPLKGFGECWRVLKPGGELLVADATSDATLEEVDSFYSIAGFPRVCKSPIAAILYQKKFRPARPVALNKEIADQLGMPPGTVGRVRAMPSFLFRTRKPAA